MPSETLQKELSFLRFKLRGVLGGAMSDGLRGRIQSLVTTIEARGSLCSDEIARELLHIGETLLLIVAAQTGSPRSTKPE